MRAHVLLPELIRRLIHCTIPASEMSASSIPSNIFLPGWDGELKCSQGNAWVPSEASFWEISTALNIQGKFREDYKKRSKKYFGNRTMGAFVFVTPRKMPNKCLRVRTKPKASGSSPWTKVRVLDSTDLAEWLETPNALSVRVWFAEQIGMPINGLVDVDRLWDRWANASEPAISQKLILADRGRQAKRLQEFLKTSPSGILEVYADSREESAAFVAATTLGEETRSLADRIIVVEENPECIEMWTTHAGEVLPIFLLSHENMLEKTRHLSDKVHILVAMPKSGQYQRDRSERQVLLPRISVSSFEKELVNIGIYDPESKQKAHQCFMSVTVFRRHHSKTSYVKSPEWAQGDNVDVMVAVALAGAWDCKNSNDCDFMCSLIGCDSYQKFERKINEFTKMNDVPIEFVGRIRKVKSRFDALKCVLSAINPCDLDIFLEKIKEFYTPDVRVVSEVLSSNVFDTMAILSNFHINDREVSAKISQCVGFVLNKDFDKSWNLTPLAEASPDVFLDMVEKRVDSAEYIPLNSVLSALAILAWDREHFPRVVKVLVKVIEKEGAGCDVLCYFFLPWLPSCGATKSARKKQIEYIKNKNRNIAFDVCIDMLSRDTFSCLQTPMWRVSHENFENFNVSHSEIREMREYAFSTAIEIHGNCVNSIVKLLQAIFVLNQNDVVKLTDAVHVWHNQSHPPSSGDVAQVQKVIGDLLYRYSPRSLHEKISEHMMFVQEKLKHLYGTVIPIDTVHKHLWLFSSNWPDLPDEGIMSYEQKAAILQERRCSAIKEILIHKSEDGVWEICKSGGCPFCVGKSLPEDWTTEKRLDYMNKFTSQCPEIKKQSLFITGMFFSASNFIPNLAIEILTSRQHEKWEHNTTLSFLLAAPPSQNMWDTMESFAPTVTSEYWKNIDSISVKNSVDLKFFAEKLLHYERPWDALERAFWGEFSGMSGSFVARLYRAAIDKKEAPSSKRYVIEKVLSFLRESEEVGVSEVRNLEVDNYQFMFSAHPKEVFKGMANDPGFFIDAVQKSYNRLLSPEEQIKWQDILRQWDIPPGLDKDGCFSDELFNEWVEKAVKKAHELSLQEEAHELLLKGKPRKFSLKEKAHEYIGSVLICLPWGDDGIPMFNCRAAREFLDGENVQEVRYGYSLGVCGSKEMSGWVGEGGEKSWEDARKYREISRQIKKEGYSRIATVYEDLAEEYEKRAEQEDIRARDYPDE